MFSSSCWQGTPFRAFSATAVASSSTIGTDFPAIPEAPATLTADPAAQALASNIVKDLPLEIPAAPIIDQAALALEPTFASLGLGGWSPVGALQTALEFLHVDCGLPWWGTIIASTIAMRLLLTPVVIISQRNAAKMNNAMPDIQKIQLKMTEARQRGNAAETAMLSQELMQAMTKNNISPLKNMLVPLCQAPIFMSFFFGIRRMVNAPVESMQTGGLAWFTDLTVTDPYYILPLATCVTLLVTIEVGADFARLNSPNAYLMKYVMRAIPVITLPFIINFPAATVLYWTTSNAVSLIQVRDTQPDKFFPIIPSLLPGHFVQNSGDQDGLQYSADCQTQAGRPPS